MWTWFLLLIMAIETTSRPTELQHFRLCGSELANALDLVCESKFYFTPRKRSESSKSMHFKKAFHPRLCKFGRCRRNAIKRGVSSECCRSTDGCDIDTLRSYCLTPSSKYTNILVNYLQTNHHGRPITKTEQPVTYPPPSSSRPPVFSSHRRKFGSYFYLHSRSMPTRNPLS